MGENITLQTPMGEVLIPFSDTAILDFLRRVHRVNEAEETLEEADIVEFLEGESYDDLEAEWLFWEEKKVPVMLHDLELWLSENFEIMKTESWSNYGRKKANTIYQKFKFPNKIEKRLPIRINYYLRHLPTDARYVWKVAPMDGVHIECQIQTNPMDENASIENIKSSFDTFVATKGVLKNSTFDANYQFLKPVDTTFDDVILSEKQDTVIHRNIVKYIQNLDFYAERGLPTSRGVLITGPPGTGKTLTCSAIINSVPATKIYITADAIQEQGKIDELYELAQGLSPSVVIVEDIDTLGGLDRRETGNHPLLGEFLNCLNGVESNDGVITIATTNYPEHLDKALTRAGRFDIKVEFGYPNEKIRQFILEKYLSDVATKGKINLEKIVKETENFSGAFLKEIVTLATISTFEENGYASNTKLCQKHLDEALNSLLESRSDQLISPKAKNDGFAFHG